MVLSILHRMTGIAMSISLIVFAALLMRTASGPEAYLGFSMLKTEIPLRPTVTTYRLEQANQALVDLKRGRVTGANVLLIE